jgi:hypothetical protein
MSNRLWSSDVRSLEQFQFQWRLTTLSDVVLQSYLDWGLSWWSGILVFSPLGAIFQEVSQYPHSFNVSSPFSDGCLQGFDKTLLNFSRISSEFFWGMSLWASKAWAEKLWVQEAERSVQTTLNWANNFIGIVFWGYNNVPSWDVTKKSGKGDLG